MSQELINSIASHIRKLEDSLSVLDETISLDGTQAGAKRALRLAKHETARLHRDLNEALLTTGLSVSTDSAVVYSGGQPKTDNPPPTGD